MGHLILLRATRETTVNETSHLSIEDAASYIDGTLSDDAREVIERHLAECDTCREEVAASSRLIATLPATAGRRLPWRLVLPLAAGILVAVVLARPTRRTDVAPAQERGAPSDASLDDEKLKMDSPQISAAGTHARITVSPVLSRQNDFGRVPCWSGPIRSSAGTCATVPQDVRSLHERLPIDMPSADRSPEYCLVGDD